MPRAKKTDAVPKKGVKKSKASSHVKNVDDGKKSRKKKDPNAPKKAMSAFMFFSNDIRETVKKERPDLPFLEIAVEIGARWKALNPAKRKKYEAMAAKDKTRYEEQKEDYVPDPSFDNSNKRKKKDPNAPKRSLSAYLFFCNDVREQVKKKNPDKKMTEIASVLATQWNALPEKKRGKYDKMAETDKKRYEEEMAAYNAAK